MKCRTCRVNEAINGDVQKCEECQKKERTCTVCGGLTALVYINEYSGQRGHRSCLEPEKGGGF